MKQPWLDLDIALLTSDWLFNTPRMRFDLIFFRNMGYFWTIQAIDLWPLQGFFLFGLVSSPSAGPSQLPAGWQPPALSHSLSGSCGTETQGSRRLGAWKQSHKYQGCKSQAPLWWVMFVPCLDLFFYITVCIFYLLNIPSKYCKHTEIGHSMDTTFCNEKMVKIAEKEICANRIQL